MTTLAPLLPDLAHDLSGGDDALVAHVRQALENPPSTTEEVGYYGASGFPPAKNCFLFTITQLGKAGHLLSAEDKYVTELLDLFAERVELPQAMKSWFPKRLGWNGDFDALGLTKATHGRAASRFAATYHRAMAELEGAFEAKGQALRLLQFHMGDTMPFILVDRPIAEKWSGVPICDDEDGRPLGLVRPDWERFFHHLCYAVGWELEYPEPP